MNVILIDPFTRTITTVPHSAGDDSLANPYRLIQCDLVEAVGLRGEDVAYVNEEGMLGAPRAWWTFEGRGPYTGRAVIVGCDAEGDDDEPTMTVAEAWAAIDWTDEAAALDAYGEIPPPMQFIACDFLDHLNPVANF